MQPGRPASPYSLRATLASPRAAAAAVRRVTAFLVGRRSSAPPVAVAWDVTYQCNCFCSFCATHELHLRTGRGAPDQRIRIARALVAGGVKAVALSGGEVLLVPYLRQLIEVLTRGGVSVYVNTNGSHLARWAADLVQLGVRAITLSVDRLHPEHHEQMRERPGLSAEIERGIESLLRSRRGSSRPLLRLRFLVTAANYVEIVPFVDRWHGKVEEIAFQPIQSLGPGDVHQPGTKAVKHFFSSSDRAPLRAALDELMRKYPAYDTFYYRHMTDFLFQPESVRNRFHCLVPAVAFKVLPNGDAVPCSDSSRVLGNVLNDGVQRVWMSPYMEKLRTQSRLRTRTCLCWSQQIRLSDTIPSWAYVPISRVDA